MDVITKMVLANALTMFFTAWVDKVLLGDITNTLPRVRAVLGGWALLTIISGFFWVIWCGWGWWS